MGSSRLTRTARGDVIRADPKPAQARRPKPELVEVADATGERSVEGRDPRSDPWPGDVLEDGESRIRVLRVWKTGEAGWWNVEAERFKWRKRRRSEPERGPEWRGWTLSSWRMNMLARGPTTTTVGVELPAWDGARVVERASGRVEAIPGAGEV